MLIQPYLMFEGRCDEALNFYKQAVDAKIEMLMRYKDNPEPPSPDHPKLDPNKIMHASFTVGHTTLFASDGMCSGKTGFSGINLTITVDTEADADRIYNALAAGGQIRMPLMKTFYSPKFGMLTDKFGVDWMVMVKA